VTTYHVRDIGTGSGVGSYADPWRQVVEDPSAIPNPAVTAFRANDDEILVHYSATASFAGWTAGDLLKRGLPVIGVDSQGIRWDSGAHYLGAPYADDRTGLYSRMELPRLDSSARASEIVELYLWQSLIGFEVAAGGVKTYGVQSNSAANSNEIDSCWIHGATLHGITDIGNAAIVRRTLVSACDGIGISAAVYTPTIEGCTIVACGNGGITVSGACTLQNNLVIGCTGGTYGVFCLHASSVVRNVNVVDNATTYGIRAGGTVETCNAYSSDGGLYHTSGNWYGGAPAGGTELASMFVDAAGGDYHLTSASPLAGAGTTIAGDFAGQWDASGLDWEDPPSIGPHEMGAVALVSATATTLTQITALFDGPVVPATVDVPLNWTVATEELAADVAVVDALLEADQVTCQVYVHPELTPGASYTVTCPNAEGA
jgi:hypothetical protein